jgi:hypothetical protein
MIKRLPLLEPPRGRSSSTSTNTPFHVLESSSRPVTVSLPHLCSVAIEVSGRRCDAGRRSLGSVVRSRVIATSRLLPRDTRLASSRRATDAGARVIVDPSLFKHDMGASVEQRLVEPASHGGRTNCDAMPADPTIVAHMGLHCGSVRPRRAKQSARRPSRDWSDREVRPPAGASSRAPPDTIETGR